MMSSQKLLKELLDTAENIEEFSRHERLQLLTKSENQSLQLAALKLIAAAQVLLPPRGKSTTTSCPHCGNDIDVSVTKA